MSSTPADGLAGPFDPAECNCGWAIRHCRQLGRPRPGASGRAHRIVGCPSRGPPQGQPLGVHGSGLSGAVERCAGHQLHNEPVPSQRRLDRASRSTSSAHSGSDVPSSMPTPHTQDQAVRITRWVNRNGGWRLKCRCWVSRAVSVARNELNCRGPPCADHRHPPTRSPRRRTPLNKSSMPLGPRGPGFRGPQGRQRPPQRWPVPPPCPHDRRRLVAPSPAVRSIAWSLNSRSPVSPERNGGDQQPGSLLGDHTSTPAGTPPRTRGSAGCRTHRRPTAKLPGSSGRRSQHLDPAARAGRPSKPRISGEQDRPQGLGQCHVSCVVHREVVAQLPAPTQQRPM